MSARPKFARRIKPGDKIAHPTRGTFGTVVSVHHVEARETPGRPWGVMSGWMENPADPRIHWGWTYPAESLVIVLGGTDSSI